MTPDLPEQRHPVNWRGTSYPLRGLMLLLAVGIFWGFNWPVMKISMAAIPVFTFRAIAIFFGGLCLAALCRLMG